MSLAAQKQRLLQQVNAILIATTQTFGDRYRDQFVSFRQQGFPVISTEDWLVVGAVFVNGSVMLLDERGQHFQLQAIFDSSEQDALISLVDTLHDNGLSAWRSVQYCELLNEHNGPAMNPVTDMPESTME